MRSSFRIALAQLNSVNSLEKNIVQIEKLILSCDELPDSTKPKLMLFPENSLFFRIDENEKVKALNTSDEIFKKLQKLSIEKKMHLHLTSAIEEGGQIWNASVLISPIEKIKITYKKIHLFDIALSDQKPIRESDVFTQGDQTSIFEIEGIKFGSSICYDLRFSELYSKYAKAEVDVLLVPSAFLVKTGLAHWEVLLRARAIESQCFVLAAAQSGKHVSTTSEQFRETYGHSMAIGPWGEILALKKQDTGLLFLDLDTELCVRVRKQIPMKNHRRL
jgi:predicted amidohydrolase